MLKKILYYAFLNLPIKLALLGPAIGITIASLAAQHDRAVAANPFSEESMKCVGAPSIYKDGKPDELGNVVYACKKKLQ